MVFFIGLNVAFCICSKRGGGYCCLSECWRVCCCYGRVCMGCYLYAVIAGKHGTRGNSLRGIRAVIKGDGSGCRSCVLVAVSGCWYGLLLAQRGRRYNPSEPHGHMK